VESCASFANVLWDPLFEDFARYYRFTPRACQPSRARTKGKVESGVKYVMRNASNSRPDSVNRVVLSVWKTR
jgi:transposase